MKHARIIFPWRLFTNTTVALTGSVTSNVIDVRMVDRLESLMLKMTSTANAHDLKVQMETAPPAPVPVGTFDPPYGDFTNPTDFVTLSNSTAADFPNSATAEIAISLPPTLGSYVRFIFTGNAGNPADTSLTAVVLGREK
jgi:hypothetical protein